MIIGVSTTLFFSWLCYIISLFEVWIVFGSLFLVAVCSTVLFPGCGLLLDPVVCLIVITILSLRTKRKTVTVLDFCDLRLALAVWWLAISCLWIAPVVCVFCVYLTSV